MSHRKKPGIRPHKEVLSESTPEKLMLSRRQLMVGLGLGLSGLGTVGLWRSGVFDTLDEKPASPSTPPEAEGTPDRFRNIKLPEMELKKETRPANQLLMPELSDEQLNDFRAKFLAAKLEMEKVLAMSHAPNQRTDAITGFINELMTKSAFALKYQPGNSPINEVEGYEKIQRLDRLLMSIGYFISSAYHPENSNLVLNLFKVDDTGKLHLMQGDEESDVPIFYLSEDQNYYSSGEKDDYMLNARYEPETGILSNPAGSRFQLDELQATQAKRVQRAGFKPVNYDARAREDFHKTFAFHEGMHYVMKTLLDKRGIKHRTSTKGFIRNRGLIEMPGYVLQSDVYTNFNLGELHEIAAHGFGLMQSRSAAKLVAQSTMITGKVQTDRNYGPVADLMINEMVAQMPELRALRDNAWKTGKTDYAIDVDPVVAKIIQMPDEELHKIGERMAKLAVYLAR